MEMMGWEVYSNFVEDTAVSALLSWIICSDRSQLPCCGEIQAAMLEEDLGAPVKPSEESRADTLTVTS